MIHFQKTNRKAYLNFLRAQFEAMTGQALVQSYPYIMNIDPVSVCQLRCPICPTGVENESKRLREPVIFRERARLTPVCFDALLGELGEYLFMVMLYNWGEPLLNQNLPVFIRKAKEHQIFVEIHTNLSLRIEDAYLEDILSSGIDVIAASIDGFTQETYQTYRRGGNFELAKTNLERLAAMRERMGVNTEIIWNFLVFSFNEHEIDTVRNYCDQIGITFNRREAYITNPDWLPSYRQGEAEALKNPSLPRPKPANPLKNQQPKPCSWHYSYSAVNADGSVSPCCAPWDQKYDFGLIQPGTVSFRDVWNNNLYRKSRGAFANKPVPGLESVDSLCLQCTYGPEVQNMYDYLNLSVVENFHRVFEGKDPVLEEAVQRLSSREGFLEFYTRHMGELYAQEHGLDIVQPEYTLQSKSASRPVAESLGSYQRLKDMLKPYTARLFKRFPALYTTGKALERKILGSKN
jgi:MoaA/NifB/PqqE/SkfB family radical SAM enzyme